MTSIAEIQTAVAAHFGMRLVDMTSRRRARSVARPRQVAMYLARELTGQSFPQIARAFQRDHTTVIHGCRNIANLATHYDPILAAKMRLIIDALSQG